MTDGMTIYALSTPPAAGGIAVVRISGEKALFALQKVFRPAEKSGGFKSHMLRFGRIITPAGETVDEAMAVFMKAPRTYTREDVAELHCHGSMAVVSRVLEMLSQIEGLRLAEPGEFTKRAFLNGRMDLVSAEAVMDIIASASSESLKVSMAQLEGGLSRAIGEIRSLLEEAYARAVAVLEYPEEDWPEDETEICTAISKAQAALERLAGSFNRGRLLREGAAVAIIGRPNVGKSSILNSLLGASRAIVTDIPGTTRDIIEERYVIRGAEVRLIDTAGIRGTQDAVESIGVERAKKVLDSCDIVLFVLDTSEELTEDDIEIAKSIQKPCIIALNKTDAPRRLNVEPEKLIPQAKVVNVSAATGEGIGTLADTIYSEVATREPPGQIVTNRRHFDCINRALEAVCRASANIADLDCVSMDVREAAEALGEITGENVADDMINSIFSRFCLGK